MDSSHLVTFMARCPTPGELFDALRPWGSMRDIAIWAGDVEPLGRDSNITEHSRPVLDWGARVEFWSEEEAARFQVGFGATGSLVKGWQM